MNAYYDKIKTGDNMNKYQIINYAIIETIKAHPDFKESMSAIIYNNLVNNKINYNNFTSQNGAREAMEEITQNDLLQFILVETVKYYNAMVNYYYTNPQLKLIDNEKEKLNKFYNIFPDFSIVKKVVTNIANGQINSIAHYKTNARDLMEIVEIVIAARYQREDILREYIDLYGFIPTTLNNNESMDVIEKIERDAANMTAAANIQVNNCAINKCLADVMSGAQLKNQHNSYGLDGTLYATQDIGQRRTNQEDSVLILSFPEIPQFKMLVVSDGMGGVEHGEKASQYTVQQLAKWFHSLQPILYTQPDKLQKLLNDKIAQISFEVYNMYNRSNNRLESGATIVASIITKDATIVSSVGDSRAYAIKDGTLQLLTQDASAAWPTEKTALTINTEELDDIRFNKAGNQIFEFIGMPINPENIQSFFFSNDLYDKLILLSDGVTDLLSQEQIKIISTSYPPHMITEELVKAAITTNAIRPQGPSEEFYGQIPAGKDNATAAMTSRR